MAIALLHIPGLLPDDLRERGTTSEIIAAVEPLPFVPYRGALGLFNVPDDLIPAEAA